MKSKAILLILSIFLSVQVNSQVRKPQRLQTNKIIKFEFKEGIQKLKIPKTKSIIMIQIKGRNFKIINVKRISNRKTYRLVKADSKSCDNVQSCNIGCWKDPETLEYLRISRNCNNLSDEDELNGQIELLGPDM